MLNLTSIDACDAPETYLATILAELPDASAPSTVSPIGFTQAPRKSEWGGEPKRIAISAAKGPQTHLPSEATSAPRNGDVVIELIGSNPPSPKLHLKGSTAKTSKAYVSGEHCQDMHKGYLFARILGRPLNSFFTIRHCDHDDWNEASPETTREQIRKSIGYAWQAASKRVAATIPGFVPCSLYMASAFECAVRGVNNLHGHYLLHVPPKAYLPLVTAFRRRIALQFRRAYVRQLQGATARTVWGKFGIPGADEICSRLASKHLGHLTDISTPADIHEALIALRSALRSSLNSDNEAIRKAFRGNANAIFAYREHAIGTLELPILFEHDCADAPLAPIDAEAKLAYMCGQIDPDTKVLYLGVETTISALAEANRVKLKAQSQTRRFTRRNLTLTNSLNIKAQTQAGFDPPAVPLADWFLPKGRMDALKQSVRETLDRLMAAKVTRRKRALDQAAQHVEAQHTRRRVELRALNNALHDLLHAVLDPGCTVEPTEQHKQSAVVTLRRQTRAVWASTRGKSASDSSSATI